jgi:hypothetical protein
MNVKRIVSAASFAACLVLAGSVAAAASPAAHPARVAPAAASHVKCADAQAAPLLRRYKVKPGESMAVFIRAHGYAKNIPADVSDVLGFTFECTPGFEPDALNNYIDKGKWTAPLKGIPYLWSWRVGG